MATNKQFPLFHCTPDNEQQEEDTGVKRILTRHVAKGALVYRRDHAQDIKKHGDGEMLVDRGMVLIQRDASKNILVLSFFSKDMPNDHFPELIVPFGSINNIETKIIASENRHHLRGRMRIHTCHTLNSIISLIPWVVTIKMTVEDVDALMQACAAASDLYNQDGLVLISK
jgi:hypothetical protein